MYIKFNAIAIPGADASSYDKIFVGEVGGDSIILNGLKKGKYFIYVTGYDSLLVSTKRVVGVETFILTEETNGMKIRIPVIPKCCQF